MANTKCFTDLQSWREAHKLVLLMYRISKKFPADERFGLTSQTRRAAISTTSNFAEGFGRNSAKDKMHFYNTASASLAELQNQLLTV